MQFIDIQAQKQYLGDKITTAINKVLEHGKYIMGPEVQELESELSRFCGVRNTITCGNGTDALILALMANNLQNNDVVICPSFTFAATAEAIAFLGGVPFFADVDENSFNISVDTLETAYNEALASGYQVKGIISVDLFGNPIDYESIMTFCTGKGIWHIADAAQSFAASYKDKKVGNIADITTTSFFPAKPLGCYGDGGAVFTNDDNKAAIIRSLRIHGKGEDKYDNVRIGMNSRLDTIQAAILLEKLKIYQEEIEKRNKVANTYNQQFASCTEIKTPSIESHSQSVWAQYTIKLRDTQSRDEKIQEYKQQGIPTVVYYPKPLHKLKAFAKYPKATTLINSEYLSQTVLSLPMHPYLYKQNLQKD